MKRILVVDDDIGTLSLLKIYLSKDGYNVDVAKNGKIGLKMFKRVNYDLVILDMMMPEMDGVETLLKIRNASDIPVVFVTAKDGKQDKIQGFLMGCDDYLIKPVDLMELKLRIETILKRVNPQNVISGMIQVNDITIDEKTHTVSKADKQINLTSKEFDILLLLAKNKGQVFSVQHIYEAIWDENFLENDRTVITHIGNIRDKLGDRVKNPIYIKIIWGVSYKIEK